MIKQLLQLPILLAADLHFTANLRDEYRWGLIDWILLQVALHGIRTVIILGDLTDAKDNHSAMLVNQVVEAMRRLADNTTVIVLRGNHDYLVQDHPFFRFLSVVPNVQFINEITEIEGEGSARHLFLPHTRTPQEDWKNVRWAIYNTAFMHQTVTGSLASNGEHLTGEVDAQLEPFHGPGAVFPKIWSGDIHVPQKCGLIEYVGSPYHVHFGDRFKPRCVLLDEAGRARDLQFPTLEKFVARITSVGELGRLNVKKDDQLKVVVTIPTSMTSEWFKIKKQISDWCTGKGVRLFGTELVTGKKRRVLLEDGPTLVRARATSVETAIRTFATKENLPDDVVEAGLEIAGVTQTPASS